MITSARLKPSVRIRTTEAVDRQSIQEILLDAYDQFQGMLSHQQWEEYRGNIIAAILANTAWATLLAEVDGNAVGAVLLYTSSTTAYGPAAHSIEHPIIRLLGVKRSARGQGVATALIEACIRFAQEAGAGYIYLHTSDLMQEAIALYEKLGFERVPEKEFNVQAILVKCYRRPIGSLAAP